MQNQKNQTFEQIIEINKEKIYRICRIYAVNPIEPEDLFQEVVYQIWKSYASFKGKSSIDTWIYRITLNVCMRSKEKLNKKNYKTIRLDAIQFTSKETTTTSLEDKKYKALQNCISALTPKNKSIVILSLEGLAYKEIAKTKDLTENHIAVKMKRIRKILLDCITSKIKSYGY
ncbi:MULTISPECIES: RNA polymerase sigma factor [unclassified Tenacibaculum]|uniref:RNA polymerase sigma factor n=1 Tax=unclassified Tenacibaculum TaxID=2635139 RepID=UPI001F29E711|nr:MULTISPECIES: sigma-70 family RNA polymerase sigma factor [unclassified Tenacibaculum]MCF2875729.1 sigma-70 family RNA polymerase sigma factor [Tenacibaculum sp. Cn5-1]MCF2935805.1 sigma-70 family RNA polymerase sigma factor [Tenacibaculum sp. Cn5-34]MCG7512365.1 sigma-70 family RNA polymerase sigma factor [Tenacibaculum sp. Cn5-46]